MYLKGYLWRHKKIVLLLILFPAVFAAVFSLYDLPLEAVAYAAVLCIFIGGVLFAAGYARFLNRHRKLAQLRSRITLSMDGLPPPNGLLERDYQTLIRLIYEDKARLASQADSARESPSLAR